MSQIAKMITHFDNRLSLWFPTIERKIQYVCSTYSMKCGDVSDRQARKKRRFRSKAHRPIYFGYRLSVDTRVYPGTGSKSPYWLILYTTERQLNAVHRSRFRESVSDVEKRDIQRRTDPGTAGSGESLLWDEDRQPKDSVSPPQKKTKKN